MRTTPTLHGKFKKNVFDDTCEERQRIILRSEQQGACI